MRKLNLVKVNRALEEARMILSEEESGDGNQGQKKPEDEGSESDDMIDIDGDVAGDEGHAEGDDAGDASEVARDIEKTLSAGMEQASGIVKKVVGEAVAKALSASYGKSRKNMMKEYNSMSFKDIGTLSDKFDQFAEKVAESVDLKGIVYNAIGNMVRNSGQK
jgi:hypothetical protein